MVSTWSPLPAPARSGSSPCRCPTWPTPWPPTSPPRPPATRPPPAPPQAPSAALSTTSCAANRPAPGSSHPTRHSVLQRHHFRGEPLQELVKPRLRRDLPGRRPDHELAQPDRDVPLDLLPRVGPPVGEQQGRIDIRPPPPSRLHQRRRHIPTRSPSPSRSPAGPRSTTSSSHHSPTDPEVVFLNLPSRVRRCRPNRLPRRPRLFRGQERPQPPVGQPPRAAQRPRRTPTGPDVQGLGRRRPDAGPLPP